MVGQVFTKGRAAAQAPDAFYRDHKFKKRIEAMNIPQEQTNRTVSNCECHFRFPTFRFIEIS